MRSIARTEQFSFHTKSRTSQQTWNRHRALKLCAIYSQSCMEILTILGTTALMASSFRHNGQIHSLHHQNLASGPKQLLILPKFCMPLFISFFDRNFGVTSNKRLVDLLTFKCKEQIIFSEHACATVIQPKTGVLNLLLCHGPLWESGETYWPLLTKMYLNS